MKRYLRVIMGFFFLGALNGFTWAQETPDNTQQRAVVERVLGDLHYLSSKLAADQKDLDLAQKRLTGTGDGLLTMDEANDLRDRIHRDDINIQADMTDISKDLKILQDNWGLLTKEERDFVTDVQSSMGKV